jgi:protein phosphatase
LTRDDTYVQGLVDDGLITAEQARHHPHKSLITASLQGRSSPRA